MHRGPMFDNEKLYIICYNVKSEKSLLPSSIIMCCIVCEKSKQWNRGRQNHKTVTIKKTSSSECVVKFNYKSRLSAVIYYKRVLNVVALNTHQQARPKESIK